MIIGLGTDIIEIQRIADTWARKGQRFLDRIYTPVEQRHCVTGGPIAQAERLAVRFSAKEAVMKALGTGLRRGVRWRDIEIRHKKSGEPYVLLYGATANLARAMGIKSIHITLSHSRLYAVATAIATGEPGKEAIFG